MDLCTPYVLVLARLHPPPRLLEYIKVRGKGEAKEAVHPRR